MSEGWDFGIQPSEVSRNAASDAGKYKSGGGLRGKYPGENAGAGGRGLVSEFNLAADAGESERVRAHARERK